MKICFALLSALGICLMGLGEMQRFYSEARWGQALQLMGMFYDPPRLTAMDGFYETRGLFNTTTVMGFMVFLVSVFGLLLCFIQQRRASKK